MTGYLQWAEAQLVPEAACARCKQTSARRMATTMSYQLALYFKCQASQFLRSRRSTVRLFRRGAPLLCSGVVDRPYSIATMFSAVSHQGRRHCARLLCLRMRRGTASLAKNEDGPPLFFTGSPLHRSADRRNDTQFISTEQRHVDCAAVRQSKGNRRIARPLE
jgi:hypothetical protein